jgi:GWxTD domain-containing protein
MINQFYSIFNTMKKLIFTLVVFVMTFPSVKAQPLRDINYSYLYDPSHAFRFEIKPVRLSSSWKVLFELTATTGSAKVSDFQIAWEVRDALFDKDGIPVPLEDVEVRQIGEKIVGHVTLPLKDKHQIIVGVVSLGEEKKRWMYYKILDVNYPVNGFINQDDLPLVNKYTSREATYTLNKDTTQIVSFYKRPFPPATPLFSTSASTVSSLLTVDSVYTLHGEQISLSADGLYLIQTDTTAPMGTVIRKQSDYPKYSRLENLSQPLIYICNAQEYDRIRLANNNKSTFDRVILGITGDQERARILIRNYFKRIELANEFFTSYKEGWKTDRGMVYIIFGMPDEVYKFDKREVWNYKNANYKLSIDFVRSPTIFDPDNYVAIRSKKYEETLYKVIDMWRNARF